MIYSGSAQSLCLHPLFSIAIEISTKPPSFKVLDKALQQEHLNLTSHVFIKSHTLRESHSKSLKQRDIEFEKRKDYNSQDRLTRPTQAVGYSLIREFYANALIRDEERNQSLSYSTFVKGKEVIFSLEAIHKVLNLRSKPIPNVVSYHDRKQQNDLRLDDVLRDLCVEGAQWVFHDDGRHHSLRRTNLNPMARRWYKFVIRSITPTWNRSEVTMERAVLIHSITFE
ncbi:hypothetical protein PIB30_071018 [Stylosanthes scabra]|uniref:Putative plant transposon protein domain-containing protein n=1 Tax=Stylosanthes scabra TaxID=79078 RepID=A0ABU6WRS9_9FABA|nr:hypothetical protein [Stylosanthes scabra]